MLVHNTQGNSPAIDNFSNGNKNLSKKTAFHF